MFPQLPFFSTTVIMQSFHFLPAMEHDKTKRYFDIRVWIIWIRAICILNTVYCFCTIVHLLWIRLRPIFRLCLTRNVFAAFFCVIHLIDILRVIFSISWPYKHRRSILNSICLFIDFIIVTNWEKIQFTDHGSQCKHKSNKTKLVKLA